MRIYLGRYVSWSGRPIFPFETILVNQGVHIVNIPSAIVNSLRLFGFQVNQNVMSVTDRCLNTHIHGLTTLEPWKACCMINLGSPARVHPKIVSWCMIEPEMNEAHLGQPRI
jgi:hypothetical protein